MTHVDLQICQVFLIVLLKLNLSYDNALIKNLLLELSQKVISFKLLGAIHVDEVSQGEAMVGEHIGNHLGGFFLSVTH